ncbi:MAG: sulfotransferase, partial [Myxococcota bacterium]|nr:sulfotransferase [Myxococcota bacterium]
LYERLGRTLSTHAKQHLEQWLAARSADAAAPHRYRFESTGLDLADERGRYTAYMERFEVPREV